MKNMLILVILVLVATGPALAQSDGYTLFAPMQSTTTYLIDMDGQVVHTWDNPSTAASCVYLLEDGTIMVIVPEDIQSLPRLQRRVTTVLRTLADDEELTVRSASRVYPGGGDSPTQLINSVLSALPG